MTAGVNPLCILYILLSDSQRWQKYTHSVSKEEYKYKYFGKSVSTDFKYKRVGLKAKSDISATVSIAKLSLHYINNLIQPF